MATAQRTELIYFTWGANSFGQLGLGHDEDQVQPQCADSNGMGSILRFCTGGGGHSALITEEGELLVCGQNNKGQLGLGHTSEVMTFCLFPMPCNRTIQQVSCGWDFTIILTDDGSVLTCGSNTFGQLGVSPDMQHSTEPMLVETLCEPVISIAAGLRHVLAVTGSGFTYQWGTGLSTQAKRALNPQPVPAHLSAKEPCLVPGLEQVNSKSVTAGSAHCGCLTASGDVFLWGSNKHSQLCNKESFLPSPTALNRSLLDGERVFEIHSGWTHLIAQTESSRVFTWGRANYGQLGRIELAKGSKDPESSPVSCQPSEVKALYGASQIACGSEHNLAIVNDQVFSWGWNEHGMCGDGSLHDILQPKLVPSLTNVKCLLIGCGAGHSMALCLKNEDI